MSPQCTSQNLIAEEVGFKASQIASKKLVREKLLPLQRNLIEYYKKGYMSVSFEREAYANEYDLNYLKKRKLFGFYDYL